MQTPINTFPRALANRQLQIGLWAGLANPYCAEICAGAGFDWMVLDCEHAPNDTRAVLAQLQAVAPYPVHPVVRAASGDITHIKHLLDIGAQTLLIPVVETAAQAAELVRATRYPPEGIRGVGSALARASRGNRITDYLHTADEQISVIAQVETRAGVENAAQIAAVPGIDGVFIGPADLSASLGHRGNPAHPDVQQAMQFVVKQVLAAGKAAGSLLSDETMARRYIELGCTFMAVGVDTSLLANASRALAQRFTDSAAPQPASTSGSVY
jgi:4-hydroxy-2-oxoheptanedioate aldolase